MKSFSASPLPLAFLLGFAFTGLNSSPLQAETPTDGNTVISFSFDDLKAGPLEGDDFFVIEGEPVVKAGEKGNHVEIPADPVVEVGVLTGPASKGTLSISGKALGTKRGRSSPRIGLGLHGISGYRLWLTPGKKKLELARNEEILQEIDFNWEPDVWFHMKITLSPDGENWIVNASSWKEGTEEPVAPLLSHKVENYKPSGKASFWAVPFAGTPILWDDLKIEAAPTPATN